jgi:hypothetical protein
MPSKIEDTSLTWTWFPPMTEHMVFMCAFVPPMIVVWTWSGSCPRNHGYEAQADVNTLDDCSDELEVDMQVYVCASDDCSDELEVDLVLESRLLSSSRCRSPR